MQSSAATERSRPRLRSLLGLLLLLTLLLAPGAAPAAQAGEPGWIPLGPDAGQEVRSLAVLGGSPGHVFAAGTAGLFRTEDGSRWELLNDEGLPLGLSGTLSSTRVAGGSLYLVPGLGSRIFVEPDAPPPPGPEPPGIFKSSDGGATWRRIHEGTGLLAVSAVSTERLYLATTSGIETSFDGGETWQPATPDPLAAVGAPAAIEIADLAIAPSDPDNVYILLELSGEHGFPDEILLLRSRDAGESWESVEGPSFEPPFGVRRVAAYDLAIDPLDPDTLYVALSEGVSRSTDGGATWESRSGGLPFSQTNNGHETTYPVTSLLLDPEEPGLLYAATRQVERAGGGVYRSADAGSSWFPAGQGLPPQTTVHDLVFDTTDSRTLYAATPEGVFRSTDRSDSWTPTPGRLPTPAWSVALDPANPARLFAGSSDGRIFTREGDDQLWRRTALELQTSSLVTIFAIPPTAPSLLFVHGLSGADVQLGRSTDGGATWTSLGGPRSSGTTEVLVDPRDSNRVFASVDRLGGVFVSTDQGTTWNQVLAGRVQALAQAPSNPDVLYAGLLTGEFGPDPGGVCRSEGSGASWGCTAIGLPGIHGVPALAIDPRDSSRVLASLLVGGLNRQPAETVLVESLDGGATWEPVEPGLPAEGVGKVADLLFAPRSPQTVWAASQRGGVFRSDDDGRSWTALNRGLTHPAAHDLDLDPGGRGLVAATGTGVFRFSSAAGPAPPPEIDWVEDSALPGFRVKARIDQGGGATLAAAKEPVCIPETVCLSGAVSGRSELFVRVVGPKPNGFLWPTLVKFSTSRIEIWIQQTSTGEIRYYELRGASPGFDELPGLFDRLGFSPD